MIEVLDTAATATCRNCHQEIQYVVGDLGTAKWIHAEDLKRWCPNAPLADPIESTIKEAG